LGHFSHRAQTQAGLVQFRLWRLQLPKEVVTARDPAAMKVPYQLPARLVFCLAVGASFLVLTASMEAAACADEDSPPPSTREEPSAPMPFAWGGWYLGGHAGYAHGRATFSNAATNSFGSLYGGALIGYAVEFSSQFLLGLEADVSFPNFRDNNDQVFSHLTSTGSLTERLDLLGRARGRIGYASGRWLIYGAGGFAWSLRRLTQSSGQPPMEDESLHFRPGLSRHHPDPSGTNQLRIRGQRGAGDER
jgi:high affinity Mn2+ porin